MTQAVLVVEDNPITRKIVRLALASEGYEVLEAETAAAALEAAPRADLVLQDLTLGDVDGFDLVGQIRAKSRTSTPILAFTGLRDRARVCAAGFADHLIKPIEPSRLIEIVRAHLGPVPPGRRPTRETLPRPSEADRWRALADLLQRAIAPNADRSPGQVTDDVLTAFLDATGLSIGAAFECPPGGELYLQSQIGFSRLGAGRLTTLRSHPVLVRAVTSGQPVSLCRCTASWSDRLFLYGLGVAATLIVPLMLGSQAVGVLVLASANPDVSGEWLELARVVAAPVAQALVFAGMVARVAASEQRFRGVAEAFGDGIVTTNAAGAITYANPAATALVAAGELAVGQPIIDAIPFVTATQAHGQVAGADGQPIAIEIEHRAFGDATGPGEHAYVLRDLSARKRLEEYARFANEDALTGLCNRRRFDEALRVELAGARRYGSRGSVVMIDLDRFKPVNDEHGHLAGDAVLVAVSEALRSLVRETDLVARLGGDEFAILLRGTDAAGAGTLAAKAVARIAALEVPYDAARLRIGASAGAATFPDVGTTVTRVIGAADEDLYRAKRAREVTGPGPGTRAPA